MSEQSNAALEALKAKQLKDAAEKMAAAQAAHAKTQRTGERTFYSRLSGSTHIFTNGKVAQFVNGEYVTDREAEIAELEELCGLQGNHMICATKVPVQNFSDAVIAREVGRSSVTGMVNTANINNLTNQ